MFRGLKFVFNGYGTEVWWGGCFKKYAHDTQDSTSPIPLYLPLFIACVSANRLLKGLRLLSRGGGGWRGGGSGDGLRLPPP